MVGLPQPFLRYFDELGEALLWDFRAAGRFGRCACGRF